MVLSVGDRIFTVPSWVYAPLSAIGYAAIALVAIPFVAIFILIDVVLPR